MDKARLEGRLRDRINKYFTKGKGDELIKFRFEQYHFNGLKVTVFTSEKVFDFENCEKCNDFINSLIEVPSPAPMRSTTAVDNSHSWSPADRPASGSSLTNTAKNAVSVNFHINGSVLGKLKDITMASIEKLQAENGGEFIPQAQQINNEIKQVMALAKTEIEMVKTKMELENSWR